MGVHLVVQIIACLLFLANTLAAVDYLTISGNCSNQCGSVEIPYPFGIGDECSMNTWFTIECRNSTGGGVGGIPFLSSIHLEVLLISIETATVEVNNPIMRSVDCRPNRTEYLSSVDLGIGSPFVFSETGNNFVAFGCRQLVSMTRDTIPIAGCFSTCNGAREHTDYGCTGIDCCQAPIPPMFKSFNVSFSLIPNGDEQRSHTNCSYGFVVVDSGYIDTVHSYTDSRMEMESIGHVPAVLEWALYNYNDTRGLLYSYCFNKQNYSAQLNYTSGVVCFCRPGHGGNPYLPNGCERRNCLNGQGGYACSSNKVKVIIIGVFAPLGALFLLAWIWCFYKFIKKRMSARRKQRFFKRNGGLLLKQQLSSSEGTVERATLYTSKELEKATDRFNQNRILGHGGQGTVYKGMLSDGRIVAVKKAKIVDEGYVDQFVNELAILSQINHRNVVKLLGCCLETEVPLLVYELVSNGTLFQRIHDANNEDELPLSWEMRLRIAIEVASALAYLHSAASFPIYHRDIKSSNILLDDKYKAKVSDFGTSRSVAIDQTHVTTIVQGTFGYLDPEYFQSNQFTDKSDVYSFGVVIVELLTGQKPISTTKTEEGRSLALYFIQSMKDNRLFEILDARVLKEGGKEEVAAVAVLAKRCLKLNGKKRPTMREVAMELEGINRLMTQGGSDTTNVQEKYEEVDLHDAGYLSETWDAASASTRTFTSDSRMAASSSSDVLPLLYD